MPTIGLVRFVRQPYLLAIGVCVLIALHLIPTAFLQTANGNTRGTHCDDLVLCEVGLLSWWVAIGCRNVVLALSGWIAGVTALLAFAVYPFIAVKLPYGSELSSPALWEFQWLGVLGSVTMLSVLSAPLVLVCFFVIGHFLWRSGRFGGAAIEGQLTARRQFSLRDIFVLLTVVAGSLGAMTTLQPYPGWMTDGCKIIGRELLEHQWVLFVGSNAVEVVLITTAAQWVVFGRSRFWARCAVLATSILLSGLIRGLVSVYATVAIDPGVLSVISIAGIVGCAVDPAIAAAMSAASFLLLRLSGCPVVAIAAPLGRVANGTEV